MKQTVGTAVVPPVAMPPVAQGSQHGQMHLKGIASNLCEVPETCVVYECAFHHTVGHASCPHGLAPRSFRTGSLQQRTQQPQQRSRVHRDFICRSAQAAAPTQLEAVAEDKWIQRTLSRHSDAHSAETDM